MLRAYGRYFGRRAAPTLLREDFAGTAAVAAAWVALDPSHQAMAVESHAPTLRWAHRHTRRGLGGRADDLHLVCADVMRVTSPKVDLIAALNFSTFIYHDRAAMLGYLRHARRGLRKRGVLVIDAYGGPGAMRIGTQTRRVQSDAGDFDYHWEQRACDAVTARVGCRIHFTLDDGRAIRSAFRYDWRLWTLPELLELMREAGFSDAGVWCDAIDPRTGLADGRFRPRNHMPARQDWVAYVVGVKSPGAKR